MANWSNPALTSTYTDFLNQLKDRDTDLALQFDGTTSSNLATNTIRWDSTANRWKKWNGSTWAELTATYALTALSTTGNASVGGNLSVTGSTALAAATASTPATADNNTNVATTAFVKAQNYAPLASPTLTGTPAAPTASTGTNTTQIATTAYVNAEIANDAVLLSGGTMSGALTLSQDPTSDMHAVTKRWVESLAPKEACRVSTTANITLSGLQTIDGISVSVGDRVLVRAQSNVPENGIYVASSGAWSRASDANTWDDLVGATVSVLLGTANAYTTWLSTAAPGGTIDISFIFWQLTSNQQVSAIGNLSGIGLVTRTGANTFAVRSLFVSGVGLAISDQNGASVGPTISSNATSTGTTANTIISRGTNGDFTAGTATLTSFSYSGNPTTTSTGAIAIPSGTTGQRPAASTGHIRFNSSLGQFEGYNGSAWGTIGGGAKGGGSDQIFFENGQTVTTDYTVSATTNAMSAGPIAINSGITVTITSGGNWSIV